jgi:hypothetical protein
LELAPWLQPGDLTIPPGKKQPKVNRAVHASGDSFTGIASGRMGESNRAGGKGWRSRPAVPYNKPMIE